MIISEGYLSYLDLCSVGWRSDLYLNRLFHAIYEPKFYNTRKPSIILITHPDDFFRFKKLNSPLEIVHSYFHLKKSFDSKSLSLRGIPKIR
jgi:hypothetical protein